MPPLLPGLLPLRLKRAPPTKLHKISLWFETHRFNDFRTKWTVHVEIIPGERIQDKWRLYWNIRRKCIEFKKHIKSCVHTRGGGGRRPPPPPVSIVIFIYLLNSIYVLHMFQYLLHLSCIISPGSILKYIVHLLRKPSKRLVSKHESI